MSEGLPQEFFKKSNCWSQRINENKIQISLLGWRTRATAEFIFLSVWTNERATDEIVSEQEQGWTFTYFRHHWKKVGEIKKRYNKLHFYERV